MTSRHRNKLLSSVLFAASFAGAQPALAANRAAHERAAGEIFAADMMGNCNGVALIGGADYQAFVLAATEVASQQGLRKNKLRKLLFYGQTAWLKEQAADVLSARGIDAGSQRSVCSLARKVAGKNDAIGRYLELE